jgi:4-amino-4-deoxy-L-arabinose transferase-like glycosyltransferase
MIEAFAPSTLGQRLACWSRALLASGRGRALLLDLILGLALGLRVWGLSWGLPWAFHPDEGDYTDRAQNMVQEGDLDPDYFKNPTLFTYLVAGELALARAVWPGLSLGPGSLNLLARANSALIGTASVALLYAAGTRLRNRRLGLLAALFLAVSFLHVRDSHYGVNDVPALGLLLASFYCSVRLFQQPGQRWYLAAGCLGGLAVSTKYNMGFFFVPLLVGHGLALHRRGQPLWSRASLRALTLAALAGLAGFLVGTPYALLDYKRFWSDFSDQLDLGNAGWSGQSLAPVPLQYLLTLVQGFGLLGLALAAVGAVAGWRVQRAATGLVLCFPLTYLAFMLPKALFFARFALPLLPFICLLAATGALALVRATPRGWREPVLAVLVLAALAQPLLNDVQHNRLLARADTRVLAASWVRQHLAGEGRLKMGEYTIQDTSWRHRTNLPPEIEQHIGPIDIGSNTDEVRELVDRKVQYVVISSFTYGRADPELVPDSSESGLGYARLYRSLESDAQLVARFAPGVGDQELPFRLESLYTPFWDIGAYERPGPTISIYVLAPLKRSS